MDHHWACDPDTCADDGFCNRTITCGYQLPGGSYCDCTYDDFDIDRLDQEFCWMHEEHAARALEKEDPVTYAAYEVNVLIESRLWRAQILLMRTRLKRAGDEWLDRFNRLSVLREKGFPHTALEILAKEWGVKDWELSN